MATFTQKLRVIVLGAAHDLVDKEIDMNSPSALRQYVRDVEEALDKLQNEAAIQAGLVRTLTREKGDLEARINTDKANITKLLEKDPAKARTLATGVVQLQAQLARKTTDLETQKQTSASIDQAAAKLKINHDSKVVALRNLERIDRDSKIKERAATSLNSAGKLISGGADQSIDDIEAKMRERNDAANEKFDRAMGSVTQEDQEDPAAGAVDDLLSQLAPSKTGAASK